MRPRQQRRQIPLARLRYLATTFLVRRNLHLVANRVLSSPTGRKTIAQRFNAGWTGRERSRVPAGTAEIRRQPSALSSLAGLGSWVTPDPSVETLGYFQTSLRDWAATARCVRDRSLPASKRPNVNSRRCNLRDSHQRNIRPRRGRTGLGNGIRGLTPTAIQIQSLRDWAATASCAHARNRWGTSSPCSAPPRAAGSERRDCISFL